MNVTLILSLLLTNICIVTNLQAMFDDSIFDEFTMDYNNVSFVSLSEPSDLSKNNIHKPNEATSETLSKKTSIATNRLPCDNAKCSQTFIDKKTLKKHLPKCPYTPPEQLLACTIKGCIKKFINEEGLSLHLQRTHGKKSSMINSKTAKKLCCQYGCRKTPFSRKSALIKHLKTCPLNPNRETAQKLLCAYASLGCKQHRNNRYDIKYHQETCTFKPSEIKNGTSYDQ